MPPYYFHVYYNVVFFYCSIDQIKCFSILLNVVYVHNGTHIEIKKEIKPEDHWSCIAHLSAEDILKSAVIEEKKFKSIESE